MSSDEEKFESVIHRLNEVLLRQDRIEERLAQLERASSNSSQSPASTALPEPTINPVAPQWTPLQPLEDEPPETHAPALTSKPRLESKLGLTLLNRIGVITLVLGIAFFFKWAADTNWVGPLGRVLLGIVAGIAALVAADSLWRRQQQIFAQGITGAGIAVIYLSLYAAFDFYHLIPQPAAFLLLLATTAMAAKLALRYNAIAIAALGFFGAYVVPWLLSDGKDRPWFLVVYLLLINFAVSLLATRRGWKQLEVLSFAATLLIFGGWLATQGDKLENRFASTAGVLALCAQRFQTSRPLLFVFSQALTALSLVLLWGKSDNFSWLALVVAIGGLAFSHFRNYAAIVPVTFSAFWISLQLWLWQQNTPAYLKPVETAGFLLFYAWTWWRSAIRQEASTTRGMSVFALNGIVYYAIAYVALHHEYHQWLGPLAVAVAVAYLAFGAYAHRKSRNPAQQSQMPVLALGVSAAFLTLAIPIQLAGSTITIAWSLQAAALTWIGVRLISLRTVIAGLVVFACAFLRVLVIDSGMYSGYDYPLLLNARFLTFAVLAIAFLFAAYYSANIHRRIAFAQFAAGHLVMLTGFSLEVIGWAERSSPPTDLVSRETIGISILFSAYAVLLVSVGVAMRSAICRFAGLVLTAIVILKLYLYDVWQLGRVYQIVAFVILGVLLLSTSFLYSRFKGLIEEWRKDATQARSQDVNAED